MTSGQEPSWRACSAVTVVIVRNLATVLALSALVLAGCGGGETTTAPPPSRQASSPATSNTPATPSQSVAAAHGTLVTTADSQFGDVLFDDTGQAIYLFDKEQTTQPECYDECADAWPPVLTESAPVPALGARADELGTTTRTDGTTQVTYAGHPLYYYAHEGKNQVLCHDVREFGGLWLAVTPSGEAAAL
jgi:predicted lipoprotein with Yx(FWY)xxD motif